MRRLVLLGLAATGVLNLSAAGFDPSLVASDAQWVAFVDVETFRQSNLGQQVVAEIGRATNPAAADALAAANGGVQLQAGAGGAQGNLSFDFQKIFELVSSVTAFGTKFSPVPADMDGTLIVRGTPELRKMAEAAIVSASLMSPKDFVEVTGQPFETYFVGNEVYLGFPAEQVILASRSKDQLLRARDLVRGGAASLAQTPNAKLASLVANSSGAYALTASLSPPPEFFKGLNADSPPARILALVTSGASTLSERGAKTNLHLTMVARDDDSAAKLLKITQGLTAMVSLSTQGGNQVKQFLDSSTAAQDGRTVTLDISYQTDRLFPMFRNLTGMEAPPIATQPPSDTGAASRGPAIAQWRMTGAPGLTHRLVENVPLHTGSTIAIYGQSDGKAAAFLDRIEITPTGAAGAPLRFEAESARLNLYSRAYLLPTDTLQNAIGRGTPPLPPGSVTGVSLRGGLGTARFEFPGADGNYSIDIYYRNEPDGAATMALRTEDPK